MTHAYTRALTYEEELAITLDPARNDEQALFVARLYFLFRRMHETRSCVLAFNGVIFTLNGLGLRASGDDDIMNLRDGLVRAFP